MICLQILKGIGSRYEYFLNAFNFCFNVFSVYALIVVTVFVAFLLKNQSQTFILLLAVDKMFENSFTNPFQRPKPMSDTKKVLIKLFVHIVTPSL
jgi:hypothetical protein